jgi:hypothetical protein
MIDKPIYKHLQHIVGEAHGYLAVTIILDELSFIFEEFADETQSLYDDEPKLDKCTMGYRLAADWCRNWSEEIKEDNV